MISVEIYSRENCHLCEAAKNVMKNIQHNFAFQLREIIIQDGDEHYEEFKERIPVIFIDKKFAFQYRVKEDEFLARLQETQRV